MGTVSVTLPSDGQTIDAADYNVPINTIVGAINGGLDSNNIASSGIVPNNLQTGTGTSWSWQSYTTTLTNWTIGTGGSAGTVSKFIQIGKTVHFFIKSTLGTSGQSVGSGPTCTLPLVAHSDWSANMIVGSGTVISGGTPFPGFLRFTGTSSTVMSIEVGLDDAGAATQYVGRSALTSGVPNTFGAGDSFIISGTYEAA